MKEEDIRKREVLNRYLELVREDCETFFGDRRSYPKVGCPACLSAECAFQFEKNGFDYVECNRCDTLFVQNRPPGKKLASFYAASPSTSFWVNDFFKPVAEARREAIFRPRAEFLAKRIGADPGWLVGDIGAGFGIFLEEMRKYWPSSRYIAIEPSTEQADICANAGLVAECTTLENLVGYDGRFDLLTAFELLEHLPAPMHFMESVSRLLRPGGWFFMTTLNGEGFDIQVLWEKAKAVTPPHHLNFLNPASLGHLLRSSGLHVEEIETPGRLDWDIVEGVILHEGADPGRFWKLLSRKASATIRREFQEWLSRSRLSSHMRAVARKPI